MFEALRPFFPHVFFAMPVVIGRPVARWDDDDIWTDDEPGADEIVNLDDTSIEEFSPMPGEE